MRRTSAVGMRAALALVGLALAPLTHAAVLSWTGVELLSEPRAAFPTQTPSVNGTSLVFGTYPFGTYPTDFAKLVTIDLSGLLTPNPQGQINLAATIGLTRLACITTGSTAAHCANPPEDWDAQFYLGDGINLFGGDLGDNAPGAYSEQASDLGNTIDTPSGNLLYASSLFPAIGQPVEMTLAFTLRPGVSKVAVQAFGQSADFQPTFALDLTRPLSLAFVRDNDGGEQYQLNFIQINYPNRAPEPGTLALAGLAAAALAFRRRALPR